MAETIIESLYPKKFYHNVPSMTSSTFVTKKLKKSEWVNNPEAIEAVQKEVVGLRNSNLGWCKCYHTRQSQTAIENFRE